jgi:hypothetical protein
MAVLARTRLATLSPASSRKAARIGAVRGPAPRVALAVRAAATASMDAADQTEEQQLQPARAPSGGPLAPASPPAPSLATLASASNVLTFNGRLAMM